jgi:hypothetical protein
MGEARVVCAYNLSDATGGFCSVNIKMHVSGPHVSGPRRAYATSGTMPLPQWRAKRIT